MSKKMRYEKGKPCACWFAVLLSACMMAFVSCNKEIDLTPIQKTVLENELFTGIVADMGWQIEILDDARQGLDLEYSAYLDEYLIAKIVENENGGRSLMLSVNATGLLPSGTVLKAQIHSGSLLLCQLPDTIDGVSADFALTLTGKASCVGGAFAACRVSLAEASSFRSFTCGGDFCLAANGDSHCIGTVAPAGTAARMELSLDNESSFVNFGSCLLDNAKVKVLGNSRLTIANARVLTAMDVELETSEATVCFGDAALLQGSLIDHSTMYFYGSPDVSQLQCDETSRAIGL